MITAKLILTGKETYDPEYPTLSKSDALEAMVEFTNLHLDAAIKEWSEHLFRHNIEVETPMNYKEWLRHYKNRNNLK